MTNTQLKSQVDLEITNKIATNSVTPSNVGENIKGVVDYIDQEIAAIELTPGPTGPAGVAGPVGPAGLTWQGAWVSGTSYVVDDAVGYNGASWFCVNPTSGTTSPNLDPINWALLAAQGSPGPQGAQGIQGIQGEPGPAGGVSAVKTTETLTSTAASAPFPYSTADFAQFISTASYALPPTPALGEIRYIKTAFANCTLWASPNPGNDGANNNFYTPSGNGSSYMSLVANKSYRFTYIGRYGATYGYWTVEIMNNI